MLWGEKGIILKLKNISIKPTTLPCQNLEPTLQEYPVNPPHSRQYHSTLPHPPQPMS